MQGKQRKYIQTIVFIIHIVEKAKCKMQRCKHLNDKECTEDKEPYSCNLDKQDSRFKRTRLREHLDLRNFLLT